MLDLVASTLPSFKGAYVAHAGGLWLVSAEEGGQLALTELIAPPPPVTEEEAAAAAAATTGKGKRRKQGKGKGKVQGSPD